jgi:hypothetical protein
MKRLFADFTVENLLDPLPILKTALPFTSSPTHFSLRKHGELLDVKSALRTSLSLAPGATSETTLSPPDSI